MLKIGDSTVSRIGLGGQRILREGADQAKAVLRRAVDLGVTLIDTADVYGDGASERVIAETLHPYPAGLVVATKGGQAKAGGKPVPDGRPEHLRAACETSLKNLRVDRIDLYQLHNRDPAVPLEESLGALTELQAEGKIRHIGVSNLFAEHLELALSAAPVSCVQLRYSLIARERQHELEVCERHGLPFLAWAPLGEGVLARSDGDLEEVAHARGADPARVALAWLLQSSAVLVPIPGTASTEHLESNLAATSLQLSEAELERLSATGS